MWGSELVALLRCLFWEHIRAYSPSQVYARKARGEHSGRHDQQCAELTERGGPGPMVRHFLPNSETGEGEGALFAPCSSTIGWPDGNTPLRNMPHPKGIQ